MTSPATRKLFLFALLAATPMWGCFGGGGGHQGGGGGNPTPAPSIQVLSINSGPVGASVTITGSNFGATQGASTVTFNGTPATSMQSWGDSNITVLVPANATSGNVIVTVAGQASNAVVFTVTAGAAPSITSINPSSGPVGSTVTITGMNFGAPVGTNTILFNGSPNSAPVISWSATTIVITVPVGATTGGVTVTTSVARSNAVLFTVTAAPPAPSISNLNPTSGPVGTTVTVTGTNFGSSQGSSTVVFNGTTAAVTTWSATSIVVKVPSGATSGSVVVTVGGAASNAIAFTVTVVLPPPSITSLNPTSGPVGTPVTITGTNFGSSQGSSTVMLNCASLIVTSWSATSIGVDIPAGATTSSVVVTVGGVASNGVSFTVTSSGTGCASGGNAAALFTGDYAFREQAFGTTGGQPFVVFAGRFHVDGVNAVTNGLLELNSLGFGGSNGTPLTFTGCFVLNAPGSPSGPAMGTMNILTGTGISFTMAIAIRVNGNGNFINFDTMRGAGNLEKQCPNAPNATCPAFSNSNISADYGMAFDGFTATSSTANAASVGRFHANAGALTGAVIDVSSASGVLALNDSFSGTYGVTDTANGRATVTASVTYNSGAASGTAETFHFACYLAGVNNSGVATTLLCMGLDTATATLPLMSGRIVIQNTPTGGWTVANAAPASNASVFWSTGINGSGDARIDVGQLIYNTSANPPTVTVSQDQNHGGVYSFVQGVEDIGVASNGRLQVTESGSATAICYLLNAGDAFCVNEANNASLGSVVPQEAKPSGGFTTANFDNSFAFSTLIPATLPVNVVDGVAASTGSTGTFSGLGYGNSTSGLSFTPFAGTYSIVSAADAVIGRVSAAVTSPAADTLILYIIDANTAVAVSTSNTEPAVIYFNH